MDTPEVQEVVKLLQEQLAKFGDDKSTSILLAFAEGLPSAGARLLCSEIRCLDVSRRQELAQTLLYAILLPSKTSSFLLLHDYGLKLLLVRERSKTPTPIDSRLAWLDDFAETTSDDRPDSTSKSSHQKLRADCLRRDSKKCLITGFSDLKSLSPEESQAVFSVRTECAHILPFSLGSHAEATVRI